MIFCSCATKSVVREAAKTQGHWETKAQVKDLKNQKTNFLQIDFVAIRPDKLRAEVTGTLGVSVATLTLNKGQIQMANHNQKKYYSGKISDRVLSSIFGIHLDPRILLFALFDEPLPEKSFQCSLDAQGLVQECKGKQMDLTLRWSERNGELKRVVISRADFEVQILVKDFTTKVQESVDLFKIEPPAAYKSYQLD